MGFDIGAALDWIDPLGAVIQQGGKAVAGAFSGGGSYGGGGGAVPLGPGSQALDQLFGVGRGVHGHGSDAGQSYTYRIGPSPFDNLNSTVADFINNPIPITDLEQSVEGIGSQVLANLPQSMSDLRRFVNAALEGAETGFRVDVEDSILPQARRITADAREDTLERFSGYNTLRGTDTRRILDEGDRRQGENIGALQLDADLAASRNRLGAIPLGYTGIAAQNALPLNVASDVFGLSSNLRNLRERNDPRQREINLFNSFTGLGNDQQFQQSGFNPNNSTNDMLGSLAEIVPALFNAGSESGFFDFLKGIGKNTTTGNLPDTVIT